VWAGRSLFEPCCCLCCGLQAALRARLRMQLLSLQAIVYLSVHVHVPNWISVYRHISYQSPIQRGRQFNAREAKEECQSQMNASVEGDNIIDMKQILMNVGSEVNIEVRQQLLN